MPDKSPISWLKKQTDPSVKNVATELTDEKLSEIGQEVVKNYNIDLQSRAEWEDRTDKAMKLAKQVFEKKTFPTGEDASSVKYPILAEAAINFAARMFPEVLKGTDIAKCAVTGDDPDNSKQERSERISIHLNYQLTKVMKEWLPDKDQALHTLPIVGGFCHKSYFDASMGRNVSELVSLKDYVVNQNANRHKLRRETHRYWFYKNDLLEKMRSGLWIDLGNQLGEGNKPEDQGETDQGHEIIEQHCFYDLDGDEYKEPWIITVHKATAKVLRVVARYEQTDISTNDEGEIVRIAPTDYFTLYRFLPDPDGGFYPIGLGHLVYFLSESIDTILNQLIDAGTLANRAGGFISSGVKLKGGKQEVSPFRWQFVKVSGVKLRDAIFPVPVRDPSPVLFQLLGLLIEATKGLANIRDVLSGDASKMGADVSPTTVMAMVEQGLKVYTGIYKRFYDALTEELRKLYRLNAIYLDKTETFRVAGKPIQVGQVDYQEGDLEVLPVADPNMATDMQRRLQAQALLAATGRPGLNEIEITRRYVHSLNTGENDKLLISDKQMRGEEQMPPMPPNPKMMMAMAQAKLLEARAAQMAEKAKESQAKIMEAGLRFRMDSAKFQMELQKLEAEIGNIRADTMYKLANADDEGRADGMEVYHREMDLLENKLKNDIAMAQAAAAQMQGQPGQPQGQGGGNAGTGKPGNVQGMAARPGDAEVPQGNAGGQGGVAGPPV